MKHFDVLIVGGGVVGSATAYYLKKHRYPGSVAIVEKDTSFQSGCTARSVGGLRQQFSTPENIALSKFGLQLMRNLKAEFGAEAEVNFREQGYLIMASPEGLPILEENHRIQISHGADNKMLNDKALAAQFSWLNRDGLGGGCLGLSGEGWLDPWSLMSLLRKAAGVPVITGEVAAIAGNRVTLTDGETIAYSSIVNAAGAGAGAVAAMAGLALPVEPRKRYVYVIDCPAASEALRMGPLVVDPSGVYFRPEGRHFVCGLSPVEHEEPTEMNWEVDYTWFEERIWPVLAERVPHFEAVKVINAWAGHYDYNVLDQNGIFGPHPDLRNFYFANGFSGHGLQQGPASGNAIAELLAFGEYRAIDLARFGYDRIARHEPLFEKNIF